MRILSIDTSSYLLSVALADDNHIVACKTIYMERGQGETLAVLIQQLFQTAQWDFNSLNQVLVAVGPGSFTGVRIGLSAARGLGLALNVPVTGISNFNAVLPLSLNQNVCVALDTKRGDCFVQSFDVSRCPCDSPLVLPVEKVVALNLPIVTDKPALFDGYDVSLIDMPTCPASHMIDVFLTCQDSALPPEPLYLREADVTLPSTKHVK